MDGLRKVLRRGKFLPDPLHQGGFSGSRPSLDEKVPGIRGGFCDLVVKGDEPDGGIRPEKKVQVVHFRSLQTVVCGNFQAGSVPSMVFADPAF